MNRPPQRWNLKIYRGATFRDSRIWSVGSSFQSKLPVDLTGCSARAKARRDIRSNKVLFDVTTGDGGIILGGASGWITMFFDHLTTDEMPQCCGVWDMELIFPDGDVRRLFAGSVSALPGVTYG